MNIALIKLCNKSKCHHFVSMTVHFRATLSAWLTQRGNKVFMGTQGLHAALVLIVPDTKGLVISTAHYKSPTRMEQHSTHPVIMAYLRGEKSKRWMKNKKLWVRARNLPYDAVDPINSKSHLNVYLKKISLIFPQKKQKQVKYRALLHCDMHTDGSK